MGVDSVTTGFEDSEVLQFIRTGFVDVPFTANTLSSLTTVPHGLGFIPVVLAYMEFEDSYSRMLPTIAGSNFAPGDQLNVVIYVEFSTDKDNIYFNVSAATNFGGSYPVKYYLFRYVSKNQT